MNREIIFHRTFFLMAGVMLLAGSCQLQADDDTDHFLLPETPPTIERMKRPPLDRPVLKRQNFLSDEDIVPPPVLLGKDFHPFFSPEYPVSMDLARGSFASSYADFIYTSKTNGRLSYHMLDTRGESPNLARNDNLLVYRTEKFVSPEMRVGGSVDLDQNTVWTQGHNLYHFEANADWYGAENINIKARLSGARGEIVGVESDASFYGDVVVDLQPAERQDIRLSFSPRQDSAFANDSSFFTTALMYRVLAASWMTVGAGGRYQKNTLYPQGELTMSFLPRLSFSVMYQPGMDRPEWAKLYANDRYELTTPGLIAPESSFFLKERLSYYWSERSYFDLSLSQAKWKNYVYWAQVPATAFIAPVNSDEDYVSALELDFRHTGETFTPTLGVQMNSNSNLPFVPDYSVCAGLEARCLTWTVSADYRYVAALYYAAGSTAQLPAFGNLSLALKKEIVEGIALTVGVDNLLGQTIETQPGFVRTSAAFQAGINLKF